MCNSAEPPAGECRRGGGMDSGRVKTGGEAREVGAEEAEGEERVVV